MFTSPQKKELAAYYTPSQVSDTLCNLAIKSPDEVILEPSFGGCSFLESSWNALAKAGSRSPQSQIYGCDVDPFAFKNLKSNFPKGVANNFLHKDFLKTSKDDFGISFTTIIGNPPFLPVSKMTDKSGAWKIADDLDFDVPKKSSLWVYFILHSLKFLRENGNLFFIVPDSLIFTNYGAELLHFLRARFFKVGVMQFNDSLFISSGTKEKTSFLMCEGFGETANNTIYKFQYGSLQDVLNHKVSIRKFKTSAQEKRENSEKIKFYYLSEVADVKIGIVTGANKFLLAKKNQIKKLKLDKKYYYPIASKNKDFKGLTINDAEIKSGYRNGETFSLISFKALKSDSKEYTRIRRKLPAGTLDNATFKNRQTTSKAWYEYDDGNVPDMFLLYHTKEGPRLIINDGNINCTNSIHRVYLKRKFDTSSYRKLFVISFLTTYSRKSAQKLSRKYTTGLLKLEPGGAKNVLLPVPTSYNRSLLNRVFIEIDALWRNGQFKEAVKVANNFVFNQ